MIKSREMLKNFIIEKLNIEEGEELEKLTDEMMRILSRDKETLTIKSSVIKKEQIERGEVEVKPVKWKKLD